MSAATLFLCGDVMTGRGIDQSLPHPGNPTLHEPWVCDARHYVGLAAAAHGEIARPLEPAAIWGDAIAELDAVQPAARIINLETAITRPDDWCRCGCNGFGSRGCAAVVADDDTVALRW